MLVAALRSRARASDLSGDEGGRESYSSRGGLSVRRAFYSQFSSLEPCAAKLRVVHKPLFQNASVVKLLSCFASNEEFAGGSPAGCAKFWLQVEGCRLVRFEHGSCLQQPLCVSMFSSSCRVSPMQRRPAQNGKVEGASPSRGTNFAHVVQRRDGALKMRTVPVQIRPWAPAFAGASARRATA